jgi:hypothetical protein
LSEIKLTHTRRLYTFTIKYSKTGKVEPHPTPCTVFRGSNKQEKY